MNYYEDYNAGERDTCSSNEGMHVKTGGRGLILSTNIGFCHLFGGID